MSQLDNNRGNGQRGRTQGSSRGDSFGRQNRPSSGRQSSSQGQSARMNAAQQARKNSSRRRKPPFDYTKLALLIGAVLVIVVCGTLIVKGLNLGKVKETMEEETTSVAVTETEVQKEVQVEGVTITGLSREKAKETLLKQLNWDLTVTYQEEEYQVKNLLEEQIDSVLDEIYEGESKDVYNLDTSSLEDAIKAEAEAVAKKWDVKAQNGAISSFDKEKGRFVFSGEKSGRLIDQEQLISDLSTQIKTKKYQASIEAQGVEVAPEITGAQAKEKYKTIGTYKTKTTSNKARNTNIRLASEALDGVIIKPGEEFSFNNATGPRSESKGYRPAGAYVNGILVEEPGGGVCQVSSTLYNAVVFSGLKTTERHAHSYEPSYVIPGEDAMVSYGGPDMKFTNNSKTAVGIRSSFSNQELTISIYGVQVLEDGVTLSMKSHKVSELEPPEPTYEEDQSLEEGVEVVKKEATKGSRWVTNLVTKKNGEVINDEFFHNSSYRAKPAIILRNTSGIVIPKESESPAESSSSESVAESTAAPSEPTGETKPTAETPVDQTEPSRPQEGPGAATLPQQTPPAEAGPGVPAAPETTSGFIAPNPSNT